MSIATTTAPAGPAGAADRYTLREMRVRQVRWEADGVVSLELTCVDGSPAPEWTPGSHVDLVLPSGLVRQYSLCSDPADRSCLKVAVLRDAHGRGGSREVHETPLVGRTVGIRGPRNHFKLRDADEYLLIAGGIGITPVLTMARELDAQGAAWRLVYGGRSRATMAFLDELAELDGDVTVVPEDEAGLPDLDAVLDQAMPGTEVWCCGPEGLLRAVEAAGSARGIPVHVERFGTAGPKAAAVPSAAADVSAPAGSSAGVGAPDSGAAAAQPADGAFEVELAQSGITLTVDPDRTILETVREHLPEVISSCEEGFCGACETPVLDGTPDHRDQVLDPVEREANETMMICVGRACSTKLVLDL